MGSIGMPEIIVIFVVILMLFGSKKLPELARGLGQGLREFKRATNEFRNELEMDGVRNEFNEQIKGNIDEIKHGLEESINTEPRKVQAKSSVTPKKKASVRSKSTGAPKKETKTKSSSAPRTKTRAKAKSSGTPKKENNKES